MELNDIIKVLRSTGLDVGYQTVKKGTQAPFLVYTGNGADTFLADGTVYHQTDHYDIEYYFEDKDPKLERKIESTLLSAGLIYGKSEDVDLEDSDLHYITYSI